MHDPHTALALGRPGQQTASGGESSFSSIVNKLLERVEPENIFKKKKRRLQLGLLHRYEGWIQIFTTSPFLISLNDSKDGEIDPYLNV